LFVVQEQRIRVETLSDGYKDWHSIQKALANISRIHPHHCELEQLGAAGDGCNKMFCWGKGRAERKQKAAGSAEETAEQDPSDQPDELLEDKPYYVNKYGCLFIDDR
jgi:hypothetical protein